MRGKPVYTSDGDKIGNLDVIYYDESTGEPEWIEVKSGFLGMKHFLVPVMGAQIQDGEDAGVRVPYPKDKVNNIPDIEGIDEDTISEEAERRLYMYYGLQPSERRSESVLPEGQMAGRQYIGSGDVPRGRARFRKWVDTEPVSEEVQLRRQTVPHQKPSINQLASMRGKPVYASDGDKIGDIDTIYYDESTGEPEWIGIKSGFLGTKRLFVPVEGAQFQDGERAEVRVPYPKAQVNDMPDVEDADEDHLSEESERRLYSYYSLQPSERRYGTQPPEGWARGMYPTGPEGEVGLSRHEEELQVGKREEERGRVRLRKWVETEEERRTA